MSDTGRPHFPPPEDCTRLYVGKVMHQRMGKIQHRFVYAMFALVIDLKRLDETNRRSPLFSVNRPNLFSFYERDHLFEAAKAPAPPHPSLPTSSALHDEIAALLAGMGHALPNARILLLCYPRMLQYVFNPISVYFCHDGAGALRALVYEVRNTFGDCHRYVAPLAPENLDERGVRQSFDKKFYVSPFLDMAQRYHFRLRPPTDADVALRILEERDGAPTLAATFHGQGEAFSTRALLKLLVTLPFATIKVMLGIHFEALRLWLKGVNFYHRPKIRKGMSQEWQQERQSLDFLAQRSKSEPKHQHKPAP